MSDKQYSIKDRPFLEVVTVSPLRIRSSPDTSDPSNIIDTFGPSLIVERLDNIDYPDAGGSGAVFYSIRVSNKPIVQGFAAGFQVPSSPDSPVDYFLLPTISAQVASQTLRKPSRKPSKRISKKICKEA